IVTSLGVLEYVPRPSEVVARMAESLTAGGYLVISFPNRASLFRRLLRVERALERGFVRLRDRVRGTSNAAAYDNHYQHRQWKLHEAVAVLERVGLLVEEVRVNTFGPWGRLGRSAAMHALSNTLSQRW